MYSEPWLVLSLLIVLGTVLYPHYCHSEEVESPPLTGSWANCSMTTYQPPIADFHPDSSFQTISCRTIHYRIPKDTLQLSSPIVIGVLSSASGTGPSRRKSIRSTWAYRRQDVLFIVAGPWEDIVDEYQRYRDLLWIDMEEIYITETSTLTYKTMAFLTIIYHQLSSSSHYHHDSPFSFLFKTDDDCK
jgi:hypothetical protein